VHLIEMPFEFLIESERLAASRTLKKFLNDRAACNSVGSGNVSFLAAKTSVIVNEVCCHNL